ncbi:MAG: PAS domain S-box protein [Anaerolineales bacterium]
MGARVRAHDWSQTPLGPVAQWPPSLRATVGIVLSAAAPLALYWGSDLVLLYNDAWRTLIGDKHPDALGRPARAVFPEIWETIGPLLESVLAGRGAVELQDQRLLLERQGEMEEAWFDYSFNPIPCAAGSIGGVLNLTTETTERVRVEGSLREGVEQYRSLFESMNEGFVVGRILYDQGGKPHAYQFVEVNAAYERLTGISREASLQKTILDLIPGLEPPWIENHARVVETGEPLRWESFNEQTGKTYSIYSYRPGPGLFASIFTDVTERRRAEEALRQAEERHRELIQNAPAGIYEIDFRRQRFTSVNESMCYMTGYSREELLAMDPFEVLDEEGRALFRTRMAQWLGGEAPGPNVEFRVRTKDGASIDTILNVTFTTDEQGEPLGATVVAHDITERKRAEKALQASEERFRLSVENLLNAFAIYTAIRDDEGAIVDFRVEYVNEAACRLTGRRREEYVGRTILELYPNLRETPIFDYYVQVVETGEPVSKEDFAFEISSHGKSSTHYYDYQISRLGDGFAASWQDVTERVRAQRELHRERQLLQTIYDTIPVMLSIYDPDLEEIVLNKHLERVTGWTPEDTARTHIMELAYPDPDYRREVAAYMQSLEHGFKDLCMTTKDGRVVETSWANVALPDGRQVGIGIDISARKRAEEALRESEERFRMAAAAAKLGAYARNLQTGENYWSPEFLAIYGLQPGADLSLREGIPAAVHPLDRPRVLEEARARAGRVDAPEFSSEYRIVRADGALRWVRVQGRMEFDVEGRSWGLSGFIMDVTERKKAEQALRESERQYRILTEVMEIERAKLTAVIDSLPVGIHITDTQGQTLSMNTAGLRLHDFESLPEMLTRQEHDSELFELRDLNGAPVPPEAWPSARALRGEYVRDQELRLRNRQTGRERVVAYSAIPVRSPADETRLLLYVMEDITERKRAEQQVQRSVAQFEALFNQMTEGLVLFDPEGNLLDMNPVALAIHGFESVESLRRHLEELTDVFELFDLEGNLLPTFEWPIGRVLRGETFDAYEVRVRRPDTGRTWIGSYGGTPVYGPDGELLLAIVTLRDVTVQRETEEALRRYTERLRFLHEVDEAILSARSGQEVAEAVVRRVPQLLPDCLRASVVLNHPETAELSLLAAFSRNEESRLCTGWRGPADSAWDSVLKELEAGHTYVVEDLQVLPPSSPLMERLQDEGVRAQVYAPLLIHDELVGTLNFSMNHPSPLCSKELEVVGELAVQLAIGLEQARLHEEVQRYAEELEALVEQRTAELRAQYARLKAVLHNTNDGFLVTDRSGTILHSNPVVETWLQQALSEEGAAQLRGTVRDLAGDASSRPERVLELPGLDLHLKAAPLDNFNGDTGVVIAAHDVSHLKTLERMRSQFITDVSHELRTPITTISLYAQMLGQGSEKQAQYVEALQTESRRLGQLVEEIVRFSQIAAGRLELASERLDLAGLVEGVVAEYREVAEEGGVSLIFEPVGASIPVRGDREKLERTIRNLLDNATRYTEGGGSVVVSVATPEWDGVSWATVSVADTGSGIAPAELSHVFERFFRGAAPRKKQLSGTGLGLAVVKELVELHEGWVTVESRVGEGSTFTVWLPLA